MSCINPNSPEFQEILKTEPNFLLAELLYKKQTVVQDIVLYDDVRDLKSETPVKADNKFIGETTNWDYPKVDSTMKLADSDLIELINDPKYKITDNIDLEKFNELSNAIGEKEAYRDFYENNRVVRPSSVVQEKINKRIVDEETNPFDYDEEVTDGKVITMDNFINDFDKIIQIENESVAIAVAEKLSKQLNIPYEIITMEEMEKLFPNQPYRKNFYQAGKVYLVAGAFDQNSLFHEFSHPIIKSMRIQNPELFNSLYAELASTDAGQKILNDIRGDSHYAEGTPEFMEEAIVNSLEEINKNESSVPEGFIKNLFFQIKQFLRKMFGKKVDVSKLNSKTTLNDLVKMINYGEEFILDNNFLDKDLMVMFQTDYEAIKSQLKNSSAARTQDIMNEFYSVVKKQLSNFKAKNDIYKKIESELADENREGILNKIQQVLEGIVTLGSNKLVTPLDKLNVTSNTATDKDIIEFNSKINSFVETIALADKMFDILSNKIKDLQQSGVKTNDEFDQLFAIMQYNEDWLAKITFFIKEYTTIDSATYSIAFSNVNGVGNPIKSALQELEEKLQNNQKISNALQADSVIDILYDHLNKQLAPIKKDFLSQMATAKAAGMVSVYNDLHTQYYGVSPIELAELNRLKSIAESSMRINERARLNDLLMKSYDSHNISKEALKARAEGKLGDSGKWNGMIDSYMDNQDSIVGGFYSYLMKTFNTIDGNANAKRADMLEGLQPLLKAAGYDTHWLGDGKMGKEISQINRSFEKDALGNIVEYMEYRFMSNFVNHEYDYQILIKNVTDARKEHNINPSAALELEYKNAQKELEKFEEDYMHRDYTQAYYDVRKKYFSTPMGDKAKDLLEDIFRKMEIFAENVNIDPTNFGSVQELKNLWTEYQQLHSLYDVKGEEKTGDAKEIAEILSGFRNDMSEFYEWEEIPDAFDTALGRFQQSLIDDGKLRGSDAFDKALEKWFEHNTTVSIKEDYYTIREAIMFERSELIKPIQDMNNSLIDIAPMYKKVFDILKPTKDNFGQFDGTQLTPEAQIVIRDIQQDIANIKDHWIQIQGYTLDELRRYRQLESFYLENGYHETLEDAAEYEDFWDKISARLLLDFNLAKDDIIYIRDLDKTLNSMVTSGLTEHYVSTFLNFYNTNAESAKIFYDAFKFIEFSDGDVPTASHIFEVISDIKFTDALKKVNPEFQAWFERNHYQKLVSEYDVNNGSFIEEVLKNRTTSAWQFTRPDDIKFYETKSAAGFNLPIEFAPKGYLELKGVPRIPTRSYFRRSVKDEHVTKRIERDTVDPNTGELILATVDNRDRWLPRDHVPGDPTSAKNNKYIDGKYKQTFQSNNALWKLQDHLKNAHLNNQKGLDASQKLYISFPRYRKGALEGLVNKGFWRRKKERFISNFSTAVDDAELGLYSGEYSTDRYTTLTRPIGGSYQLPFNDVSTNIIDSMGDHMYSIEHFKGMRKVNSFANMFQKTMNNFAGNPEIQTLQKQIKDAALLTPAKEIEKHFRIDQIKAIIDKHFKGITIAGNPGDLAKTGLKTISGLQKWMSFTSFALDPIKSVTNYIGGKLMVAKKSSEGNLYNAKDLLLTRGKSLSTMTEIIANQYSNKQVSAKLQLLDIAGAIPNNLKKEVGKRGSNTFSQSIFEGSFFYFDRRYLSESVPVHQFLAILEHNSFMLNGKMTSLDDAVEIVNGRIQTKPGVPAEFSISYNANGEIEIGDKLKNIMNIHQSLLQKSLGVGNEFTEPELYRTITGKYVMFLLKFFRGMLLDRYQVRSKKGKKGHRRINLATQQAEYGTYLSSIRLIQEMISNKGKFWQLNKFSWQAKKGTMQFALAYLISMVIKMMTGSIGFDDDDDGLIDFYFDINAEGIFSKMRKSTALPDLPLVSGNRTLARSGRSMNWENYLKLQVLRLLLRVQKEEETFMPYSAATTSMNLMLLNSPLQEGAGLKTLLDIAKSLHQSYFTDKPDVYEKAAGPLIFQEADDMKHWNYVFKSIGINGSLVDPAGPIERENSDFFN